MDPIDLVLKIFENRSKILKVAKRSLAWYHRKVRSSLPLLQFDLPSSSRRKFQLLNLLSIKSKSNNLKFLHDEKKNILEKLALFGTLVIITDQLNTGGWAKSFYWRLKKAGEGLPIVTSTSGSYITNYFLFEMYQSNLTLNKFLPFPNIVDKYLLKLIQPNGRILRRYKETQSGKVPEFENLRHTSNFYLCISFLHKEWKYQESIIKYICKLINEADEWTEPLSLACAVRACLHHLYHSKKFEELTPKSIEKAILIAVDKLLNNYSNLRNDEYFKVWAVSNMQRSLPADIDAYARWTCQLTLLPVIEFLVKVGDTRGLEVAELSLNMINYCATVRPNSYELIASGYDNLGLPIGKSWYATGIALYSLVSIYDIANNSKLENLFINCFEILSSKLFSNELIDTFLTSSVSCDSSLNNDPKTLEGYLAGIGALACCIVFGFLPISEQLDFLGMFARSIRIIQDKGFDYLLNSKSEKSTLIKFWHKHINNENKAEDMFNVLIQINRLCKEVNISPSEKGLYEL